MLRWAGSTPRTGRCSPRRAIAAVIGAAGLVILLVSGLVLSVANLAAPSPGSGEAAGRAGARTPGGTGVRVVGAVEARERNEVAARPMPDTGTGDAYGPPDVSTQDPGEPIVLPPGTGPGPAGIESGFPQTPQGAVAQLATIESAAFGSASMAGVRTVIREWAAPAGPSTGSWSLVTAMATVLESTGVTTAGAGRVSIEATPRMGLIKGVVGDDFVVACVNFNFAITFGGTNLTAFAHCQRMVWDGQRWLIGPGPEPARAPSVWPFSDQAIEAGYKDLVPARTASSSHG